MNLNKLTKHTDTQRVMGVDASTTGMAFCVMERTDDGWTPVEWGKVDVLGDDVYDRCGHINKTLYGIMKFYDPDHVTFEAVIFVNNRSVVIQLAKVVGAMIGVARATGRTCAEVPPVTWMNYINNPTRDTPETKKLLKQEYPGKSANWYKNELRNRRKQRTMDWVFETYGIELDDDDVGDAFGVAYYATQEQV